MTTAKNKKESAIKDTRISFGELRAVDVPESEGMVVEGYAIVYGSEATNYGFTEEIAQGALDNADLSDVPFRYNHKDGFLILARTKNGSLELTPDLKGLKFRATLIDTQSNRDVYRCIQERLLDKMSFGFIVDQDKWDYENEKRTVLSFKRITDISVVDSPFYDDTNIYARALSELENYRAELDSKKAEELERERLKTKILIEGAR